MPPSKCSISLGQSRCTKDFSLQTWQPRSWNPASTTSAPSCWRTSTWLNSTGPIERRHACSRPGVLFVLIGYHPFFLMQGMPTHYHRAQGEAISIRSYVHLFSEHFQAAKKAGLSLVEVQECVIDEKWLATKPKWGDYLNWPVSFALVLRKA